MSRIRLFRRVACCAVLLSISYIPVRLAIAQQQAPDPQIILVLGGSPDREMLAADLAEQHPNLKIWVSTGTSDAAQIFQEAQIPPARVYLDTRATDTVTNFTTVVPDFKRKGIRHVYVLTSDYHIPRAQAIAAVVFGSQGITYTCMGVSGEYRRESKLRILRDVGRSVVWLITGRTGASFKDRSPLFKTAFK